MPKKKLDKIRGEDPKVRPMSPNSLGTWLTIHLDTIITPQKKVACSQVHCGY